MSNSDLNMATVWDLLMIRCYLLSGSRNRAWLKWKYRPQHPWLVLASPLASPQRPWPAQDPWVCSPPSTAQARPPHPPAPLLQSDMGTPLCLPHRQVDDQESALFSCHFHKGGAAKFLLLIYFFTVNIFKYWQRNKQKNKSAFFFLYAFDGCNTSNS